MLPRNCYLWRVNDQLRHPHGNSETMPRFEQSLIEAMGAAHQTPFHILIATIYEIPRTLAHRLKTPPR